MWRSCLCAWCCSVCVLVVYVVCLHEVGSGAQATYMIFNADLEPLMVTVRVGQVGV